MICVLNFANFIALNTNLKGDELGAEGHDVEVGPDALVLLQDLGPGHPLQPPRLELEHRNAISSGGHSEGVLEMVRWLYRGVLSVTSLPFLSGTVNTPTTVCPFFLTRR